MGSNISIVIHLLLFYLLFPDPTTAIYGDNSLDVKKGFFHGVVVKKDQRLAVTSSEFGEILAVKVSDGKNGFYHLQFITMEPNSLFLPVHLHSDMVFYVDSGNGTLSWTNMDEEEGKLRQVKLQAGDVYRLRSGSFFYIESNLEYERRKLRINAIFSDSKEELLEGSSYGAYSSVRDLVLGFDSKILQAALNVNEEVIKELKQGERQTIVHGLAKTTKLNILKLHSRIMRAFLGGGMDVNDMIDVTKKKDDKKIDDKKKDDKKKDDKKKDGKEKPFNVLDAKHDVENCNGWSLVVTSQQLDALNNSNFGVFMVNLTKAAMMGPHWNPMTAEIAVVLRGRGMVNVVCPSAKNVPECKNSRFKVEEGDVFVVPRYHPMAQMSFNNESLIFVGFTLTQKNNHPQFLVGKASVFQALDKKVMAASFGVSNTTMDKVLSAQREAIILECVSCAEEEERLVQEEIEKEREAAKKREEEEEAKRREEAERKRQEEEAERKRREEEAERKRQEEAAERKRKEEEAERKRQEEEAAERKRQEEEEAERKRKEEEEAERKRKEEAEAERKRQEEAAAERKREAAAAKKQEEEAERKRQEEEAERKQQEEAAAKKQEEEAERKRQEEEAERKRQEEAAAERKREEAAAKRQEEEAERKRQKEEAKKREEAAEREEEAKRQAEEAARKWQEEEEARKREEEKRRQEEAEEAARRQEEARKREEEAARQREEEAAARQQQEEAAKRQQEEEEAARHHHGGGGGGAAEWEGEAGSKQEEEMARRAREEEAASRAGGEGSYEN